MAYNRGVIKEQEAGKTLFSAGVKPYGFWSRLRGLQWRENLNPDAAWWFDKCSSVHTFGVKNSLDLIFLSQDERVVKVLHEVPPRRIAYCARCRAVVETRAGMARELGISINMRMVWINE